MRRCDLICTEIPLRLNCLLQTKSDSIHLTMPIAWFEVMSEAHKKTDESAWAFGERITDVIEPSSNDEKTC